MASHIFLENPTAVSIKSEACGLNQHNVYHKMQNVQGKYTRATAMMIMALSGMGLEFLWHLRCDC